MFGNLGLILYILVPRFMQSPKSTESSASIFPLRGSISRWGNLPWLRNSNHWTIDEELQNLWFWYWEEADNPIPI
jgi:hypothetical protein